VTTTRDSYRLEDQLGATTGRVTMSGVHALLRAPLDVVRHDALGGRHTAGVVCGYRGSPLGVVDTTFMAHRELFAAHDIRFVNGVNEDLAATLLWGTQQVQREPNVTVDGVLGLWYGKAPGLDRAGDALRHANLSGVPPTGGVVAAVGDDPECKSSTVPSSTEWTLADLAMPALSPATVQDVLDFGRHGYEISRRSGSWVGLKMHTDIADGYASVDVGVGLVKVPAFERDGTPWNAHLDDRMFAPWSMMLEEESITTRLDAVHHYVRGAGIDVLHGSSVSRLGIIAAGKTYGDTVTALATLGILLNDLDRFGIRIYKPALVWPLEPIGLRAFAQGLDEIVVVEEKRAFLEEQIKSLLYNSSDAPQVHGKRDAQGNRLIPTGGVLEVSVVAEALRRRIESYVSPDRLRPQRRIIAVTTDASLPARAPYFCSGCPHNRSTVVPEGSIAGGGIGCHGMALFTRNRAVGTTQMGGEGVQWAGASMFSSERHRFQNIGDGTLAHSGFLAIRQAVSANTTVTFKILANGAVAMTGGQDAAGALPIPALTRQLEAEGVRRIDVVADDPSRYGRSPGFAHGVRVHSRDDLDAVQLELREIEGVTVLIYDQECAANLRRDRKAGRAVTPNTRVMINQAVCEGCGDCGDVSNCLSVHPVDTPFGRKTRIHQGSCNLDMSCIEGDCPAFVTVTISEPKHRTRGARSGTALGPAGTTSLAEPQRPTSAAILIAGVGGTGVVTVGQVLSTAANLDGLTVSSVDQTGMAQKGGPVVSHLRLGDEAIAGSARLEPGRADVFLVFDLLTAVAAPNLARLDPERTVAVVSTSQVPTGAMVADVNREDFPSLDVLRSTLDQHCVANGASYLDAESIAMTTFGSQPAANLIVVGVAYQCGMLPVSGDSIERAITLNGVAVQTNIDAFRLGRRLAVDPAAATPTSTSRPPAPSRSAKRLIDSVDSDAALSEVLAWRVPELMMYQDQKYAARYIDVVRRARASEMAAGDHASDFSQAVARNLFHVMAYKDEYEVARLYRLPAFRAEITREFGDDANVTYLLHPPAAGRLGLKHKVRVGQRPGNAMFWLLSKASRLRGTALDPFGISDERRDERRMVSEYIDLVDRLIPYVNGGFRVEATRIVDLVSSVRGFASVKRRNLEAYRGRLELELGDLPPIPATAADNSSHRKRTS
jgi:indolepyruvate ferredoxin oxidoreductase